jgi:hypothetical protein
MRALRFQLSKDPAISIAYTRSMTVEEDSIGGFVFNFTTDDSWPRGAIASREKHLYPQSLYRSPKPLNGNRQIRNYSRQTATFRFSLPFKRRSRCPQSILSLLPRKCRVTAHIATFGWMYNTPYRPQPQGKRRNRGNESSGVE